MESKGYKQLNFKKKLLEKGNWKLHINISEIICLKEVLGEPKMFQTNR